LPFSAALVNACRSGSHHRSLREIVKVYTKEAKAAKTQQPADLNAEVAEQRGEREMFEQNSNLSAMSGRLRPKPETISRRGL